MSIDNHWIQIGTRGNSSYYFDSRRQGWKTHQNRAAQHGGYLVSLNDQSEYNYVTSQLRNNSYYDSFIGLTDDPKNVSSAREGSGNGGKKNWRWMDGSTVNYDKWNRNEPNNSRGEHVAHFTGGSSFLWNDHRYTYSTTAVIEIVNVNQPPSITSSSTASAINENTASSTVIYTAIGTDESAITWSLKDEYDYTKFSIDSSGNVALASSFVPDYEVDGSGLQFTVTASDGTFTTDKTVTLGINDVLENEFIINPENTTETKAKTLKAADTSTAGITSSHLFNIHDVTGFGDTTWGSVRIPKKLRSIIDYQKDKTASDYGWLYFKTGKSQADLNKGVFRVFAKSEDNTVKQALKFKIKPDSEEGLSYQDQAINKLNSWNLSKTKTWSRTGAGKNWSEISNVDSAVDNIFNKFKLDSTQENNFLDKFKQGTAKIAANTNNNMVIIDSSSTSDSIIVDSEIKEVDATRQAQIKQALEAEGLTIADDVTIETPINELDFSVDTLANGSAIVQLQLEEADQNINRIIKTNNQDESFVFNSTIITYDPNKHGSDFDAFVDGLQYSISYYDQPVGQDPNNPLTLSLTAGKTSDIDALLRTTKVPQLDASGVPYRHYSIIDGSAYLIDKDGDGDIEIVSAFLLDQGFFDTDDQVGLIRDPIIPIVSPIPNAPVVDGAAVVSDETPNLSGTTDNSGNTINVYAEDGITLLTSTISGSDNTWSISDLDYSGNTLTDGTHSLKITASDHAGESTAQTFDITIDTTGDFNYTNSALSYKYEIYNAADPTEKISGLLGYDFNDTDASGILFDGDTSTGGSADYNIKFYVKVEDSNAGSGVAMNLETLDVTFDLADGSGSTFFNDFSGATVDTSGTVFNTAISGAIDASGSGVRFTGAVSDELTDSSGITNDGNYHSLFELKGVTINESVGEYLDKITFTDNTNIYDTVLSRRGGPQTAAIKSISDLTGSSTTQGFDVVDKYNDVSVHEAQSNLTNLATNIYTQRYIGSSDKTNLIRANDVVDNANTGLISESFWVNTGTFSEDLANIAISDASGSAFSVIDKTLDISGGATSFDGWDLSLNKNGTTSINLEGLDISQSDISGSSLDASTIEGAKLWTKVSFDASGVTAGTDYSGSSQAFQLTGQQSSSTSGYADNLSTNLITFQGDLNYDGRVSLNDLAFLNAGKVAADASGNFTDVDADFDGDIDVADLAVLSADWGETLNYSGSTNADFSGTTWTTLDTSGITTAINTLEDLSGVTVSDASGSTLSDSDIFSDANLQLAYDNSSYTNAKSVYESFDTVGTGLTQTNSPYDTLSL